MHVTCTSLSTRPHPHSVHLIKARTNQLGKYPHLTIIFTCELKPVPVLFLLLFLKLMNFNEYHDASRARFTSSYYKPSAFSFLKGLKFGKFSLPSLFAVSVCCRTKTVLYEPHTLCSLQLQYMKEIYHMKYATNMVMVVSLCM